MEFDSLLECTICLETINKPRSLPCTHSFCEVPCLESLINGGRSVICPNCRRKYKVPTDGFPVNFLLERMKDQKSKAMQAAHQRQASKPSRPIQSEPQPSTSRQATEEQRNREELEFDDLARHLDQAAIASIANLADGNTKGRCRSYPSCTKINCSFYHPKIPCKKFPDCEFGDSCAFVHLGMPDVENFLPINARTKIDVNNTICESFPQCTNKNCFFFHPQICKFGIKCAKQPNCEFYHFDFGA